MLRNRLQKSMKVRVFRVYVLGAALAFATAAPALAADLELKAPAVLPIARYSWAGVYGGAQGGGGWDQSTWRLFSQNGSGAFYGGQLGYNYQMGQFVVGTEGDLSGSTLQASRICAAVAGSNCQTKLDYLASLRGRVGAAFERLMIYGDGGVAFGGFRFAETTVLIQSWANQVHAAGRSAPASNMRSPITSLAASNTIITAFPA
jgi:outer membrane immunogenic protein